MPNEGETYLNLKSKEGHTQAWVFQVAEVKKVSAAVSSLVDANNSVVFDRDEKTGYDMCFITNKATGHSMRMRRGRNVWVLDAYVEEEADDMDANPDSEFARHEDAAARV